MALKFGNPIVAGTVLAIPAIQSPNFVHGVSGWAVRIDGSAEFHSISIPAGSGGAVITIGPTQPVSANVGDVWYDTSNGLLAHQFNGTTWPAYQVGTGAIAPLAITPALISNLNASLIGHIGVLNPNPYLLGGDASDYTAINALTGATEGTVSVVSGGGLPAGAPYAYALLLTGTTTIFGVAAEQFGTFEVTVGQQYQVTAWVYSAATNPAIGIIWSDTSSDVDTSTTIPANTWTQISAVFTGAVAGPAFAFVGPVSAGAAFYHQALLVLPQVPGGLIQTGTVEAVQLAAGIVYAGIIDGTVVNAATFNGSTFNGTDWTENSVGSFYYAGAPGPTTLALSISPNGGADPYGTSVLNGVQAQAGSGGYIQLTGSGITYKNVHNAGGGLTPTTTLSITSNPSNDFVFFNAVASAGGTGTVEFTGPLLILGNTATQINGQITAAGGTSSAPTTITTDTWHTVTPPTNVTGTLRYQLKPDKTVMVEAQLTIAAAAAAGTLALITGLAAAYTPSTQQRDTVGFVVNGSPTVAQLAADCGMRWQANTGGSFNILGFTGGAAASGVIEISFNARYSVD